MILLVLLMLISKINLDDAKIAAARKALDDAAALIAYKSKRTGADGTFR